MKNIIVGILVIFLLVGIGYSFVNRPLQPPSEPIVTITPSPTHTANPQVVDDLRAGGSSYSDADGVFVILYPNDYSMDTQNNGQQVRFFKRGETQKGQTEIYDGVMVVVEKVSLNGTDLISWVDSRIKESTADGTTEIIKGKEATTLNNYRGFTYTVRSLGEHQYYVVQKDENSPYAVVITTLVADPQNVGYQKEVDAIFSTLALLK